MEQTLHTPDAADYRQYDRIWQRVAPDLEPYPGLRDAAPAPAERPVPPGAPPSSASLTVAREEQLPGAQMNPCCMGSAAEEMLDVLTGFIEMELADRRTFLAMSRQAPGWAVRQLREMAADETAHAQRLQAVYYLITGRCYAPAVSTERIYVGRWCPALRERYHVAACNAMNYTRAAEGTTDPCLARLLEELAAEEYQQSQALLAMLERALQN